MGTPPELSLALLADCPRLIAQVGRMRWQEWGYEDKDPGRWIEVTGQEAGRQRLPVTVVAVDRAGDAVGAVGLDDADGELTEAERRGRSPWVVGTIVRKKERLRHVGRRLLVAVEELAWNHGYPEAWVATGDEAVGFYRRCGWSDVERVRLESTGIVTTVLTKDVTRPRR